MLGEVSPRRLEQTIRKLVSFGTRNTLSTQTNSHRGIGAARDWLYQQFQAVARSSGGRMTVELQSFTQPTRPRIPQPTTLTNIVATLRGTDPVSESRRYIVSGHYDSMCSSPTDAIHDAPGADDDASGTAAVLEMARVMAPHRFPATVVFVAVAGEEQGLFGSTHLAQVASQQKWDVQGMFTNDIVGDSRGGNGVRDRRTVRVFSEGIPSNETTREVLVRKSVGGENDGPSRQLARFIQEAGERYNPGFHVKLIFRRDRYGRGGDHIPFLEHGYPAVRFTEPNEDYRHQHQDVRTEEGVEYGDLPKFVDFPYLARVTRANAAALAALALAPAAPRLAGLIAGRQSIDTDLRWAANREPDLAGYEIVWRDTTEPDWPHSRYVGNVTRWTMKGMSRDNYLFGIRAVSRGGYRSPVAFPHPVRS